MGLWRLLLLAGVIRTARGLPLEDQLMEHLLADYSYKTRPVTNHSQAVNVQISMYVGELQSIDARAGSVTANVWFRMAWKDVHLTWDPAEVAIC